MKFLHHLFSNNKQTGFDNIQGYDDIKNIVRRTLDSDENYNLLLCGPPAAGPPAAGERAKLESSFLPNRRLAVRLSPTARTCTTMRGLTRELGGAARIRTLKYAFASFGSTAAFERTMSRYRCSKRRPGLGRAPLNITVDQRRSWLVASSQAGAVILASSYWKCCSKSALGESCCSCKHRWRVAASIALHVMP